MAFVPLGVAGLGLGMEGLASVFFEAGWSSVARTLVIAGAAAVLLTVGSRIIDRSVVKVELTTPSAVSGWAAGEMAVLLVLGRVLTGTPLVVAVYVGALAQAVLLGKCVVYLQDPEGPGSRKSFTCPFLSYPFVNSRHRRPQFSLSAPAGRTSAFPSRSSTRPRATAP